eukprot:207185-Alexandrium_andersonii.AAC.1
MVKRASQYLIRVFHSDRFKKVLDELPEGFDGVKEVAQRVVRNFHDRPTVPGTRAPEFGEAAIQREFDRRE